jgi:hypothetical protein
MERARDYFESAPRQAAKNLARLNRNQKAKSKFDHEGPSAATPQPKRNDDFTTKEDTKSTK